MIWLLLSCGGPPEPVEPPADPDPCAASPGWSALVTRCARHTVRHPRATGCSSAPTFNPLTSEPYRAEELAQIRALTSAGVGLRLVPGTPEADRRQCEELPAYHAALPALRDRRASPTERADHHCLLVHDLQARTALARHVLQEAELPPGARERYREMASCRNVADQRARIVTLWEASAPAGP